MRHSDPSLTANVYTDPKLLDVAGALDTLPTLALPPHDQAEEPITAGSAPAADEDETDNGELD